MYIESSYVSYSIWFAIEVLHYHCVGLSIHMDLKAGLPVKFYSYYVFSFRKIYEILIVMLFCPVPISTSSDLVLL